MSLQFMQQFALIGVLQWFICICKGILQRFLEGTTESSWEGTSSKSMSCILATITSRCLLNSSLSALITSVFCFPFFITFFFSEANVFSCSFSMHHLLYNLQHCIHCIILSWWGLDQGAVSYCCFISYFRWYQCIKSTPAWYFLFSICYVICKFNLK